MDKSRKEKNQNIQVFVRLRPLNQREHDIRSLGVVEVCGNKEVLVRQSQTPSITKKFTFDRSFGPSSKQVDVYREVVSPLIEEVLAGYNCTVFAYGQTGTGKTHTMVGESSDHTGSRQTDPSAGIIPRSLGQLFDELRLTNSEFTVRVSYLELYNEELFDLLAPGSGESKLKMYEASKGSSEVKGLEEIRVRSKDEVYQILAQGQERRRIASTLMNAQSSRSHTVFTIVVRINMNNKDGEELVKTGKLNLVDLAGSENISKAGSDNPGKGDRKRECVVINQSLLTLGRVITALVERQPHIPYRESKLTRLLQESLGGRTKTSIIATISPGHKDLEETLSTLEYAHRARNIQNKPEVNQKVLKTTVLTEYVDENDRLRRDLMASWEKNGVYLSLTTHSETQMQLANQKKEIQEQILQIKAMKDETERLEANLKDKVEGLRRTEEELDGVARVLGQTERKLNVTKNNLTQVSNLYEEQRHIVRTQTETEAKLSDEALETQRAADAASTDVLYLHGTVTKRRKLDEDNLQAMRSYSCKAGESRKRLRSDMDSATGRLSDHLASVTTALEQHIADTLQRQEQTSQRSAAVVLEMEATVAEVLSTMTSREAELTGNTHRHQQSLQTTMSQYMDTLQARLRDMLARNNKHLEDVKARERKAVEDIRTIAEQWRVTCMERLQELESSHDSWRDAWCRLAEEKERACREDEKRRALFVGGVAEMLRAEQQEMLAAKERLQQEINRVMTKNQSFLTAVISMSDEELSLAASHSAQQQQLRESARGLVSGYTEGFKSKVEVVSKDMAELSRDIGSRVMDVQENTCSEMDRAREAVEVDMTELVGKSRAETEQAAKEASDALAHSLHSCQSLLHDTGERVNKYSVSCQSTVTLMSTDIIQHYDATTQHLRDRANDIDTASQQLTTMKVALHEELDQQQSVEDAFLNQEYKQYSPTGKTPVRKEYRYPRTFTQTSPHERIIHRFRAQRAASADDCVEVLEDSLEGERTHNGSAELYNRSSTDSAGVFVEPSPPPQPPPATPSHPPPIVKSTSESDIFSKRKNGKENKTNLSHAPSLQKLSKLRQPSSHKKVLTPQN